jgi:acyl-CoA reductase-like NAD-dependent aldehyde dehydrogenase
MPTPPEPLRLDALGPTGPYRSRERHTVTDVTGHAVAELSLVPPPYVSRAMSALGRARPLPLGERLVALAKAGNLFQSARIDGLTASAHAHLTSRVCGLGISVVRAAMEKIGHHCSAAYTYAQHARPAAAVSTRTDPAGELGTALWSRRGSVFGVQAAGNHPAIHADWLQALALGYSTAIRPSNREPLTAHRLVSALRAAGFGEDHVVLLPCGYAGADELIRGADRSLVYGGDAVSSKYAARPSVLARGPGRSKILITREIDWRDHLDVIVDSVVRGGGTGCTNATAVFVEGDPLPLAAAISRRLAALPSRPPEAKDAVLPVQTLEAARRLEEYTLGVAEGTTAVLGGEGFVDDLGDGSAALRPAVFVLGSPLAEQARSEMPFPCVWVGPWTRDAGRRPLRDTLVLTAITRDEHLVSALSLDPSIRNLYVGPRPTYWNDPRVPHDGFLADFLMESRGFVRGWQTDAARGDR